MKNTLILSLLLSSLLSVTSFAGDAKKHNKAQSIEQFMQTYLDGYEEYLGAGDQADTASVTSHFTEPMVMMPSRGPAPMATHEDFEPNIKYFLEKALKAKGVTKLVWDKLQVAQLSDTQAVVSGLANAVDKNGRTVEQRASIYLLTKTESGWAVSVNLPHSPSMVPTIKSS